MDNHVSEKIPKFRDVSQGDLISTKIFTSTVHEVSKISI